jgi:hypothetical protein
MVCSMLHVLEGLTLTCFWYDISCTVSILPVLDEMSREGASMALICGIYVSLCPVYRVVTFQDLCKRMGNFVLLPGFSFMMTGRQNAKFKKGNILQSWYKCHKLLNIFTVLLRITWTTHKILSQVRGLEIWCGLKWWYVTWMCLHNS